MMSLAQRSTVASRQQVLANKRKRAKGTPKTSTVAIYVSIFALIASVVAVGYQSPKQSGAIANATTLTSDSQSQTTSVDELIATNIAANLAETTNLSVAPNVANLSVSLAAKSELTQTDETAITKPQILQPTAESRAITTYTVKAGDSADSVAAQFSITKDTLKWANNLTSDALTPGTALQILPTDGIQYTVKDGDTTASIAQKYGVDEARIVLYNDLDVAGLKPGLKIILPGGVLPVTERPGYVAPRVVSYSYSAYTPSGANAGNNYRASAGNRYAIGNCTWYAYERRAELGRPVGSFWGNAANWAYAAASAGFAVNHTPEAGAIMQNGGGYGHVAIVEEVRANGDIVLSEMNYGGGWNQIYRGRVVTAGQASLYNFIH